MMGRRMVPGKFLPNCRANISRFRFFCNRGTWVKERRCAAEFRRLLESSWSFRMRTWNTIRRIIRCCLGPLIQGKADVVYGSRFLGAAPHRVLYFWHSVGNRLLTLLSNCLTNINLTDMETCYKVFRREVIQSIPIEEDRFGFEPEITVKVAKRRLRIYEVGISYWGRTYEEGKKIGWKDGVRAVWCLLKYSIKEPVAAARAAAPVESIAAVLLLKSGCLEAGT